LALGRQSVAGSEALLAIGSNYPHIPIGSGRFRCASPASGEASYLLVNQRYSTPSPQRLESNCHRAPEHAFWRPPQSQSTKARMFTLEYTSAQESSLPAWRFLFRVIDCGRAGVSLFAYANLKRVAGTICEQPIRFVHAGGTVSRKAYGAPVRIHRHG
jgi:hypothetical protein